jgi:hypothetical protein
MTPELIVAIKERIAHGQAKETICAEMLAVGYTESQCEEAYQAASMDTPISYQPVPTALISYGDLIAGSFQLALAESRTFFKSLLIGVVAFVLLGTIIFTSSAAFGYGQTGSFLATAVFVPLIIALMGMLMTFSLLRALIMRHESILYRDHVWYVAKHIIPLSMVTLYLTIVTQVGYLLFFIPGIAATVYLFFATPMVVSGRASGLMALAESVQLVHGRFLSILGRLVVTYLVFMLIWSMIFALGAGLFGLLYAYGDASWFTIVPIIITLVIVIVMASVYWLSTVTVLLYESLMTVPSPTPFRASLTTIRNFFGVIVAIVVILLSLFVGVASFAGYAFFNW